MLQKISTGPEKKELSKEQRNFNKLMEKISALKLLIENGKALNKKREILQRSHIDPLLQKLKTLKLEQVRALDRAFEKETFSKRVRHELRYEILEQIEYIMNHLGFEGEQQDEILTILAKYEGTTKEELEKEQQESKEEALRNHLWENYGIELEENEVIDFNDPEFIHRMRERMENAKEDHGKTNSYQDFSSQTKKEKKASDVLSQMSKSLRSVYTSLVKHLHPDKEQDEEKKIIKTEAIKKVTEAYEKKDILTLILLQIEHGIIAQENLNETADQDLKQYNKILKKQAQELEQEHMNIVAAARGLPFRHESDLEQAVFAEKNQLKKYLKKEEDLFKKVYSDPEILAQYLKQR